MELDGHSFSSSCGEVCAQAHYQARQFHHEYIGTEHYLVALCKVDTPASEVLRDNGITYENALAATEKMTGMGPDIDCKVLELRPTPRLERALGCVEEERVYKKEVLIEPLHLLAGLLLVGAGVANQVVRNLGKDSKKIVGDCRSPEVQQRVVLETYLL
jgi:ATP-dependent Clp protease ATP-binding subunit ClpA